jgi:hypothetical protein
MDESILGLSRFGSVGRSVLADGRSGALQTSTAAAALCPQAQHPRGGAARAGPQHIAGAAWSYRGGRPRDGRPGPQPGLAFDCRSTDPGLRRQAGGWRRYRRSGGKGPGWPGCGTPKCSRATGLQSFHWASEEGGRGNVCAGRPTRAGCRRHLPLDSGQLTSRRRRLSRWFASRSAAGCSAACHHSGSVPGAGTGLQPCCSIRESGPPAHLGIADSRAGDARRKRKWRARSRPSFWSRGKRRLRSFRQQKRLRRA